jgi:hypothetical protein
MRQVNRKGGPRFAAAEKLVNAPDRKAARDDETVRPGTRAQVSIGDCNGDGLPDLILGDSHFRTVKGTERTPEQEARYQELLAEYRVIAAELAELKKAREVEEKDREEAAPGPAQKKLEERRAVILKELATLRPKTERHGWVWLFERKRK